MRVREDQEEGQESPKKKAVRTPKKAKKEENDGDEKVDVEADTVKSEEE
jgi:hypothetical protein